MHQFHYTSFAQEVFFGAGALTRLREIVERRGWRRVLLCGGGSARRNGVLSRVENQLGERLVAIYEGVQAHVPEAQVAEVMELARRYEVEALLGLGGGSALGLVKAVSFALRQESAATKPEVASLSLLPIIAIPTTYAGSEMTPVYGVTRVIDGQARKMTENHPQIVPMFVLYDPQLTLDLPPPVTSSTGINALAHCIEALYSLTSNPISTALALRGVSVIMSALPRCYVTGDDLAARAEMLLGAYLAASALAHVTMALHHGLCHVLGGSAGITHGMANAIILPHAMRFNLVATTPQLLPAAEVLGITLTGRSSRAAVEETIARIDALIGSMHLPQRLREVGVREPDLPRLAQLAFQNRTVQQNPRPITEVAQLEQLLRTAW